MLRTLVTTSIAFTAIALPRAAHAESAAHELANAPVIVSADRLMPLVTYESVTITNPNNDNASATVSAVSIAFVTNGPQNTLLTIPRLGFDFVVTSSVTLGLSAWIAATLSENIQVKGQSNSQDLPKSTYWGVAPRLGYVLPLADTFALWPRVGIEYHKQNTSNVTTQVSNVPVSSRGGAQEYQLDVDVEAAVVFTPVHHFGIVLTAYGAIPLVGGVSGVTLAGGSVGQSNSGFDAAQLGVGLTLGLLGYL